MTSQAWIQLIAFLAILAVLAWPMGIWLAAVAGDTTGFMLGRKLGRDFLLQHGPCSSSEPVIRRVPSPFRARGRRSRSASRR